MAFDSAATIDLLQDGGLLRYWRLRGAACAIMACLGASCVYRSPVSCVATPDSAPGPVDRGIADDLVSVRIDYVIVPYGPGTWAYLPEWNEFVLTVSNMSPTAITIDEINVRDRSGLEIFSGKSIVDLRWSLPNFDDFIIGAGGGGGAGMFGGSFASDDSRRACTPELVKKRLFALPVTVEEHRNAEGSAFFPLLGGTDLIVAYSHAGERRSLSIPIDDLTPQSSQSAYGRHGSIWR